MGADRDVCGYVCRTNWVYMGIYAGVSGGVCVSMCGYVLV